MAIYLSWLMPDWNVGCMGTGMLPASTMCLMQWVTDAQSLDKE